MVPCSVTHHSLLVSLHSPCPPDMGPLDDSLAVGADPNPSFQRLLCHQPALWCEPLAPARKKAAETFITRFTASLIDATYISVGERPSRPPCSSTLCDILRSEQLLFATRIFRRRSRRKAAIIAVKTVNKPLSISARSIRQSQSAACVLRASVSLDAGKTAHARKVSTHPTPGFEKSPLHADVEGLLAKF